MQDRLRERARTVGILAFVASFGLWFVPLARVLTGSREVVSAVAMATATVYASTWSLAMILGVATAHLNASKGERPRRMEEMRWGLAAGLNFVLQAVLLLGVVRVFGRWF